MDVQGGASKRAVLESKVDTLRKELAVTKKENKLLAKQLVETANVKSVPRTKSSRLPKGGHIRAIIGDTHGMHLDRAAWAAGYQASSPSGGSHRVLWVLLAAPAPVRNQ